MTEIKSASDEEMAYSAKGNSDGNNGGLPQQGQAPQAAPKPYMTFAAGQVQQPSGIAGISFDFNYGARVTVPQGEYRVRFIDRKACLTVYDAPASGVLVASSKKYFIDFRIEVYEKDKMIFAHDLDLRSQKVLLKFPVGILGDILAWFPYAEAFRQKHGCQLYCSMAEELAELFKPAYPKIHFLKPEERPEGLYASYYMGIFFPCDDRLHQPSDFRIRGLHQNAAMILGLDEGGEPPQLSVKLLPKDKTRKIAGPYVCIAAQSSSQAKYWNNGSGWLGVVKHLKAKGYRVLCIDRENVYGMNSRFNIIPYGVEDFTGKLPLSERIDLLYHADFFIGLSSGLSWVANGVGIPIEVTGEHKQLLITDASGKLTFVGKEFNAGGLWDVDPTLSKGDALGLSANDWYLTNMVKTVNNDTSVLLDAADNSYAMWRNTNDSLRSRLGALASGREQADGVWARTQAGRFSGSGYEGRYNLYQLGFEKQFKGGSIYGGAIDYGDGSGSYAPGSSKDNLRSFSLYGIWTTGSGAYTNVTARVGNFSTDLESYGDYPDKASYKQHAYSLSVEYGKRFDFEAGFFVEPQAQFTLGRLAGIDYTTDRGVNGRIDGMNSAIGRIGFVMGQKIENGSDIYLKADLLHEFAGERDLQLTSDAGGTNDILTKHNDYGDTWFELGLGGNVRISRTGNFYGEVTRGFGGDINKKWSVNAGLRFTF